MTRRIYRKNEFRMDLNKEHYGKDKKSHPAYISAQKGNLYWANTITHSKKIKVNSNYYYKPKELEENPNKRNNQKKYKKNSRISRPFWQDKSLFGNKKLKKYRFSNNSRKQIRNYNKKFWH